MVNEIQIFEFLDNLKNPNKYESPNYIAVLMEEIKLSKKDAQKYQHEWACNKMKNISINFEEGSTW